MSEYIVTTINALGDSSDKYIEADSDEDAIEEGKWAFDNERSWQRTSADRTARVFVVVFSIDEEGEQDDIWSRQLDIHPISPKCSEVDHGFERETDGYTITDTCKHCGIVRTVWPDEHNDIKVDYR